MAGILNFLPHKVTLMHYTDSIDHLTITAGDLELVLHDGSKMQVPTGDVVVQVGSVHQWINNGDSWARKLEFDNSSGQYDAEMFRIRGSHDRQAADCNRVKDLGPSFECDQGLSVSTRRRELDKLAKEDYSAYVNAEFIRDGHQCRPDGLSRRGTEIRHVDLPQFHLTPFRQSAHECPRAFATSAISRMKIDVNMTWRFDDEHN